MIKKKAEEKWNKKKKKNKNHWKANDKNREKAEKLLYRSG